MIRLAGYLSGIAVSALLLGATLDRSPLGPGFVDALRDRIAGWVPGTGDGHEGASPTTDGTAPAGPVPVAVDGESGVDEGSPGASSETDGGSLSSSIPDSDPPIPADPEVAASEPLPASVLEAPAETAGGPEGTNGTELPDPALWQAVWVPFRTEASARGFAGRVSRLTAVPVQIRPAERGYQVVFAYRGDEERESTLARISAATGLRLEGR